MRHAPLGSSELSSLLRARELLLEQSLLPEGALQSFTADDFYCDSRTVKIGGCFIAYRGVSADSHSFLEEVHRRGAVLFIVETELPSHLVHKVSWLKVRSSRAALAWIYAALAGNPQRDLAFFGVTGTNGKTSTVWLAKALLAKIGQSSISCGTLGFYLGSKHYPSTHTTPDPQSLFPHLEQGNKQGISTVLMEVSSHSVIQEKLAPLNFSGLGFTSFSQDHLDFHGDLRSYWQAKWLLFRRYLSRGAPGFCSASLLPYLRQEDLTGLNLYLYGSNLGQCNWPEERKIPLTITADSATASSISFVFQGTTYCGNIPLIGLYNCENFLCAWLLAFSASRQCIAPQEWQDLPAIPGRLQRVLSGTALPQPTVYIDYAHTPDALEKALGELRRHCQAKLWLVFGCGGDRDQGKRKIMGEIASRLADVQVITADNPRGEDLGQINAAILSGFPQGQLPLPFIIEERRGAINFALTHAGENDVVLIAGKGHESTQTIRASLLAFDDYEEARKVLDRPSP